MENGWWNLRMEQKTKEGHFKVASELREKLLTGKFPHQICEQFREMIEYFGQSPIIVRSSSLLEDAFGNAFAGKHESLFCVNQGDPDERYQRFEEAVRQVYASMMPELSFGTHFFQDLVETDIFYVALFPNRNSVVFNKDLLLNRPNLLCELRPEASKYESIVHVCEIGPGQLQIFADLLSRKVLCYLA
ncbi:MAG: hypothetical protein JSW59_14015 [Phycisphaerales bacterium]|nr:MAG: hypothetical protein JSW59_14015 [Phycisphaerales bacterium]